MSDNKSKTASANEDPLFAELIAFIEEERYRNGFPLDRTTEIERELRITGDDAVEFIIKFGETFNVDVSKFMVSRYFDGEGWSSLFPGRERKKQLLIGHLEKAVQSGRLDEETMALFPD